MLTSIFVDVNNRRVAVWSRTCVPIPGRDVIEPEHASPSDDDAHISLVASLAGSVGYLLARAGGRAIRELNQVLQPYGLRSRHYTVLVVAAEAGKPSQREVGELLGLDPSAVVAIIDDLTQAGLVRREPHPDDRRSRCIVVTSAGSARVRELHALVQQIDEDLLAHLSADERARFREILRRVAHG